MVVPVLETERILLRPLSLSDAGAAYEGWTSDGDVAKYMAYSRHESISVTEEWLRDVVENEPDSKNGTWGFEMKSTGELFGSGGIMFREDEGIYEIGYNIMKKYWNRGYTTEAMRKIVEYAFALPEVTRLHGKHAVQNVNSGKVLKKLGYVYVKDGTYPSLDGKTVFSCREYVLEREAFIKSMSK